MKVNLAYLILLPGVCVLGSALGGWAGLGYAAAAWFALGCMAVLVHLTVVLMHKPGDDETPESTPALDKWLHKWLPRPDRT